MLVTQPHGTHTSTSLNLGYGVGLRTPHYRDFLNHPPPIDWLEVHTENYFGRGVDFDILKRLRQDYPISLHGVGLGIGSFSGYDTHYFKHMKELIDHIQPCLVSEHLCWSAVTSRHLNDLLPIPMVSSMLEIIANRIDHIQTSLQRTILLENVSSYVRFRSDEMTETDFLIALVKQTGCRILLDINNLYVNQCNHQESAEASLYAFKTLPHESIGEIHLAGHLVTNTGLIDHHGAHVAPPVWELYELARRLFDPTIPTLIEWDTDVPDLCVLLDEAKEAKDRTERVMASCTPL